MANYNIKKKEGFEGQKAIVLPRKILLEQCSKNSVIGNLYVTDIGYYPKAHYHYRKRQHGSEQHILIYCVEGKGYVSINQEKYNIQVGDYFIIPKKTEHEYGADKDLPWTIFWAHFTGSGSDRIVQMLKSYKNYAGFSDERLALFNSVYNQLERGYSKENIVYANLCFGYYISSFVFNDIYSSADTKIKPDKMDLAINFMQNNLETMITLKEIAQSVNLSETHFSFLFKKKTGFTAIDYFNHLKIQKTCQYLLFTDLRVKEIAAKFGMDDPYYFSRFFTRIMGVSPKQYKITAKIRDNHPAKCN